MECWLTRWLSVPANLASDARMWQKLVFCLAAVAALTLLLSTAALQAQPKDKGEKAETKDATAKEDKNADKGAKDGMAGMEKGGMT